VAAGGNGPGVVAETARTRLMRWRFNWFPAYRGTGGRIVFIAGDYSEVRVRLPLSWRTRNYVGTIFGGSIYGALDPIYMIMLIKILGPEYVVWDKAATVRFLKPGRTTLFATFRVDETLLAGIRSDVASKGKTERVLTVDLLDSAGVAHASVDKTLYVRRKQ
jgi:acyl-coenzyme A thioesterase PaaI-like protein